MKIRILRLTSYLLCSRKLAQIEHRWLSLWITGGHCIVGSSNKTNIASKSKLYIELQRIGNIWWGSKGPSILVMVCLALWWVLDSSCTRNQYRKLKIVRGKKKQEFQECLMFFLPVQFRIGINFCKIHIELSLNCRRTDF